MRIGRLEFVTLSDYQRFGAWRWKWRMPLFGMELRWRVW